MTIHASKHSNRKHILASWNISRVTCSSKVSTFEIEARAQDALREFQIQDRTRLTQRRTATRKKAFTLPEAHGGPAKAFDWVFDFTGESEFDLPEAVSQPSVI